MNNRNQIVITRLQNKTVMLYMEGDSIFDVLVGEEENAQALQVGDIYLGKVQNIVQNINSAFIEVKKDVICYLPLSEFGERKVKCGDEIVVQVRKAAVKSKQAVVTVYPEVAGRFCVVSTKDSTKSISRKIEEKETRDRLKHILAEFESEEYGIVLRTNAATSSDEEIIKECHTLLRDIHEQMEHSRYKTCFSLLRKEKAFYLKYIQSCQAEEWDRIITDEEEIYTQLQPVYGDKVVFYEDDSYSLDKLLGISSKLKKAFEKRAWLKSGGYLVIEPTEALTVIDVNTGKAIDGKRNKETTFFKINCEAALEAARQIRMRNISGIILIDFIDMKQKGHKQELMELLRAQFAKDKTRTSLVDITKLGLVEVTRMKKNKPIWEVLKKEGEE
ncbi:MAG: ribonuclease E/G [Lachnospiraceae bacterium]|nr:ribonuclease E/G [Lachnospiraceae bacterium]